MEKRYQVFVSSTYEDLREERQEVIQALLELDCIPSGMELFPAADEDQWSLIKKVIDDCDYYLVIIGGRYGSLGDDGKSYTQMEYEYALSKGKPIIAFLHAEPGKIESAKTEKTEHGRGKLEAFREMARKKVVRTFSSPKELGSVVSRSIIHQIKTKPGIGWIRSNEMVDGKAAQEILRLRVQIEQLQEELHDAAATTPPGAESLSQGDEKHLFQFEIDFRRDGKEWGGTIGVELKWDTLFYYMCPPLDEGAASDTKIDEALVNATRFTVSKQVELERAGTTNITVVRLSQTSLQTILTQFKALGLINKSEINRTGKRSWKLTPLGESRMNSLYAIPSKLSRRSEAIESPPKKARRKKASPKR